jgi:hypothetical protein
MFAIILGALLIISGVALAAARTASQGELSEPHATGHGRPVDTLEPQGQGDRLSLRTDMPGLALMAIGALVLAFGLIL